MIFKEFKVELLGKVDIVAVIEDYIPLKKAGANYTACCPFHHEKTGSFSVSREKQFYYCFGCHAHGDAITFIMEYVGLSFIESLEKLASLAGLTVPRIEASNAKERNSEREKLCSLKTYHQQIAEYFFQKLHSNQTAKVYLANRGLSREIIQKYGIGYAPHFNYLEEVFPNREIYSDLVNGGLILEKQQQFYARFRQRIMFPIRNIEGEVIAFGGRIIDKGEPKYLNSPGTILFNKSQCLYGLFEAKPYLRDSKKVFVVEGYMDVVSMAQYGFNNVVATLGTAVTGQHIQLLFRFTNQIYFCFDGDSAGRKAAFRALTNSLDCLTDDKILYFVFLPEKEDPDSYIRKYGKQDFEVFSSTKAVPLSQYLIQYLTEDKNIHYGEVKAEIIKSSKPLLCKIKSSSLRFMLLKDLAARLDIDVTELSQLVDDGSSIKPLRSYRQGLFPVKSIQKIAVTPYNRRMLNWLLINPKLASYVALPDYLEYSDEIQCLLALSDAIKADGQIKNAAQLEELFRHTKFSALITEVLKQSLDKDSQAVEMLNMEENFKHGMEKIKRDIVETEILELKELIKKDSLSEDAESLLMHLLT